jgi:amino acid adenylation domain-containing protein
MERVMHDMSNKRGTRIAGTVKHYNAALPLSAAQLGLWFAQKIDPLSAAYNIGEYLEIHGVVDPTLFQLALRQVIGEAETLRIQFVELTDGPRQIIGPPSEWLLPTIDVSRDADPIHAAEAWMKADMERPLELLRDQLFMFALFKVASNRFLWYARYHHLVMDGMGAALIARRVADIYNALSLGLRVPDPTFSSLAGLVHEDIAFRVSNHFSRDRQYWIRRLEGCPDAVSLKTLSRPGEILRQGAYVPAETIIRLQSLTERTGATLPQIIATAVAIFLHRITGEEDIIIGHTVIARMTAASLLTPGLAMNVVPLRLMVRPQMMIADLLGAAARRMLEGLIHQNYRIADIRRDLGRIVRPLFGMTINFMPSDYGFNFGGHCVTAHNISTGPVDDLNIVIFDRWRGNDIPIEFEARAGFYTQDSLEQYQKRFLRLLNNMTESNKLIGELDILAPAERHSLIFELNQTEMEYPRARLVDELIGEQVGKTPDRISVVFGDKKLSYRELNERANRVAGHLRGLGVGPDVLVGVYVERSLDIVVALLGVLKAGGAYVPLDPIYPRERLALIVDDARPLVLLTQERLLGQLPPHEAKVVCLDALPLAPSDEEVQVRPKRQASDLAYVLYTSGSTGRPKGVQIPHQAVVNFLTSMQREPGLSSDDTLLAVTTLSFDIAGLELFLPLISGARVVIAGSEVVADGAQLTSLMRACNATVMQATPVTWRLLLETGWQGSPQLKILCGGEAWSSSLAKELLPRCGSLWNMYGPTETTIWSSVSKVEAGELVAIGGPIANTSFYVLNACGQPVPVGVPGELHIGGDGVARGYLNRPELTAERFIADPFSTHPGARLYKTGDLVRYRADHRIEFLRRTDHQVKMRGFRIELGEIDSVLALHPEVRETVVVVREDKLGDKRIVAYVRSAGATTDLVGELLGALKRRLPAYMLPSDIVLLDAFPLTPNGKVDRKALPIPEGRTKSEKVYIAPRTPTEEILARIWADVLQVDKVGITDNFFELGGHSLIAVRLMNNVNRQLGAEIRHAIGQELPISAVFKAPTIEAMSKMLNCGDAYESSFLVSLKAGTARPPLFIIHGMGGNVMELIALGKAIQTPHPVYAIQARGLDGLERPHSRVEDMAESYVMAISEVQPHGPYLLAGYSSGGLVAIEIGRRLLARGEKVALIALLDTYPHVQFWPLRWWLDLLARRLKKQVLLLSKMPLREILSHARYLYRTAIDYFRFRLGADYRLELPKDSEFPLDIRNVFESGKKAFTNYRPSYYPGKVIFLQASLEPWHSRQETGISWQGPPRDPYRFWKDMVGELEVEVLPSDHSAMVSDNVNLIGDCLSRQIADVVWGNPG